MKRKNKIIVIIGVFLILLSAFQNNIFAYDPVLDGAREYMSDMLNDQLNNGEISQEVYDDLMKQCDEEYTKGQLTQKLKENLFFFAVGQYANISEDVVADVLLELSDIWDYVFWDSNTQSFGFDEGIGDYIKNGLDSIIYDSGTSDGPVVGSWFETPFVSGRTAAGTYWQYWIELDDAEGTQVYVTKVNSNEWVFAAFTPFSCTRRDMGYSSYTNQNYVNGTYTVTNQYTYQGSESLGYYSTYSSTSGSLPNNTSHYSSVNDALSVLFGWDGSSSTEPELNGQGIIVNENPTFPSLSPLGAINPNYKEIVINNYNNEYPYPPNRGLDINYYDYDYNYEVPFWEGQELETLAYPEEIEFPSLEFETIEVDQNVDSALEQLEGSWIIEFLLIAILLLIVGLIL